MNGRIAIATLLVLLFVLAVFAFGKKAKAHDPYLDWKDKNGVDCCHGRDCKPVRAAPTMGGGWAVNLDDGRGWIPVPPDAVLDRKSHDGRSHACIAPGAKEPRCFVPGEIRS